MNNKHKLDLKIYGLVRKQSQVSVLMIYSVSFCSNKAIKPQHQWFSSPFSSWSISTQVTVMCKAHKESFLVRKPQSNQGQINLLQHQIQVFEFRSFMSTWSVVNKVHKKHETHQHTIAVTVMLAQWWREGPKHTLLMWEPANMTTPSSNATNMCKLCSKGTF